MKNDMKRQINFLVSVNYLREELVQMTPKKVRTIYKKERKLECQVLELSEDRIFEYDAAALLAA